MSQDTLRGQEGGMALLACSTAASVWFGAVWTPLRLAHSHRLTQQGARSSHVVSLLRQILVSEAERIKLAIAALSKRSL
jgi:hypothetical protein